MPWTPWPRPLMITITDQSKRAASLFRFESLPAPQLGLELRSHIAALSKERKRKGLFALKLGGSGGVGPVSPLWCRGTVTNVVRTVLAGTTYSDGGRIFRCICE